MTLHERFHGRSPSDASTPSQTVSNFLLPTRMEGSMALQDTASKLWKTNGGRAVLVVVPLWALLVIGDGAARLVGAGPYRGNWSGEIVSKHESVLGWFLQLASGRAVFSATDKSTRKAPIGPWPLVVKEDGGSTIEVAVPRRVWDEAAAGMKARCQINAANAKLVTE